MSLVEVSVTIAVFCFALVSFTLAMSTSRVASETNYQRTLAKEAARGIIETLQAEDFDEVFVRYNAEPADDPDADSPGNAFDVLGLEPIEEDPDGRVGEIVFPVVDAVPGVLREDVADKRLGMPRDLDGDGGTDAGDHKDDYRILPVLIRLTWRGKKGPCNLELHTLLGDY